tara:strand:- start:123 stop:404 length:282 start_codon:yes stop_codon:yes gene_type:complete
MEKEFILCAALNFNGNIICGHRHSDCYATLKDVVKVKDEDMPQRENQGFLTSLNRYVDRKEGYQIAKANNQIQFGLEASDNGDDSILISENLY